MPCMQRFFFVPLTSAEKTVNGKTFSVLCSFAWCLKKAKKFGGCKNGNVGNKVLKWKVSE